MRFKNENKWEARFGRKTGVSASSEMGLNTVGSEQVVKLFENSNWLKTFEAAEYLRTSPKQLRNWVYEGKIKAYKLLGKSLRFKRSELDLLLEGGRAWE